MPRKIYGDISEAMEAVREQKVELKCMECGKKFDRAKPTSNTRCPKCGGTDIDLAHEEISGGPIEEANPPKMPKGWKEKAKAEPAVKDAWKKIASIKTKLKKAAPGENRILNAIDDVLNALSDFTDSGVTEGEEPEEANIS